MCMCIFFILTSYKKDLHTVVKDIIKLFYSKKGDERNVVE